MFNIVYTIPLPDMATVDAQAEAFARGTGWTPETVDENEQPITALEYGRRMINAYFENVIIAYEANLAGEAARQEVITAGKERFQQITTTIQVVPVGA